MHLNACITFKCVMRKHIVCDADRKVNAKQNKLFMFKFWLAE